MIMTSARVWTRCVPVSLSYLRSRSFSFSRFPYSNTVTFDSRPQDLLYAPDGSTLAVTCRNGYVVLHVLPIHTSIDVLQHCSTVFSGPLRGYDRCACSIQEALCSAKRIRPRGWFHPLGRRAFETLIILVFRTNEERRHWVSSCF